MADTALFLGWGEPVRGREARSVQVFGEAMQYYHRLQNEGQIESFESVILEPHGGDLMGFTLLRGDSAKLMALLMSEEFDQFSSRVRLIVDRLGIVPAIMGDKLAGRMAQYLQEAAQV